jgi:hypothetical protein
MTQEKSTWKEILQVVDTKTKVLALVCLVLEGTLLASLPQLPEADRLYAFLVGAVVLAIMLIGIFFIEYREVTYKHKTNEIEPENKKSPLDQWKISDKSTPDGKNIEIEGKGIEQFREALEQALQKDRQAFQGVYKEELNELLSLSKEDVDSITPDTMDYEKYDQLITVIKEASRNNAKQSELIEQIQALGKVAVNIASKVPGLSGLL